MSVLEAPVRDTTINPTQMIHLSCDCSPEIALCGTRLQGVLEPHKIDCWICAELEHIPCPRCGSD